MTALVLVALILAVIPAALFLINRLIYRPLRTPDPTLRPTPISVLIPARNEESVIGAALDSILAQEHPEFEVVVLDDQSTDATAERVREHSRRDPRVRLEPAPPLPSGWCGKQHACHVLAGLARHPVLVFMDADVRLAAGALAKMSGFLRQRRIQLASGVPRQVVGTFLERLLIPLIHFVLLGYLPMPFMRWFRSTAFAAGCGQLFVADASAYRQCGGHARIRQSLHDGLKLPHVFRSAGLRTDLFDATDVASCRMYRSAAEVWHGLGKNAVEGIAHPVRIVPMSLVLFGGQVLPFLLLPAWAVWSDLDRLGLLAAAGCAWLPRLLAAAWFRQPLGAALLHPIAIILLLSIQWMALARSWWGTPARWKGRSYPTGPDVPPSVQRIR
jgi:hypothetical protein